MNLVASEQPDCPDSKEHMASRSWREFVCWLALVEPEVGSVHLGIQWKAAKQDDNCKNCSTESFFCPGCTCMGSTIK